jgi:hypothetical protein
LSKALGKVGIRRFHTITTSDIYSTHSIMEILRYNSAKEVNLIYKFYMVFTENLAIASVKVTKTIKLVTKNRIFSV